MKRDVAAGALLLNAIPHAVSGLAGQRCLTPLGGPDSSPRTNLLWAAINVLGGAALLAGAPWRGISMSDADRRRMSVEAGCFAMASFGVVYELTAGRRKLAAGDRGTVAGDPETTGR